MQTAESTDFPGLLETFGRSDVATRYHDSEYGLRSDVKSTERERVADFILSHFQPSERINLLSMPGESWAFEHHMLGRHPKTQIVGVEKSATIYHRSRLAMPGRDYGSDILELQTRQFTYGSATIDYSRTMACRPKRFDGDNEGNRKAAYKKGWTGLSANARAHRLAMMDAATFVTMLMTDYGASFDEKSNFFKRFHNRNAMWLDFTSQLCKGTEEVISNLHMAMTASYTDKPVVITLMNARDRLRGADKRVERILQLQPGLSYRNHWTYQGANGTPMLTFCGAII